MALMRSFIIVASAVWALSALTQSPHAAPQDPRTQPAGHIAFDTSDNCLACHNGLTTTAGEDVSIGIAWRASMMANSSRDPYWQAAVRRETMDHPSKQAVIEDECAICHMPMTRTLARAAGRPGEVFRLLPTTSGASDEHRQAADGVSCTVCHQIGPERLGTRESFVGGFVVRPSGDGERRMFGPFDVDSGRTAIMRSATDVRPAEAAHVRQSELCATCHTLFTDALGPAGEVVGSLPEQVPYLEWRHSGFAAERSCQSCHMPEVRDTPIASVLGKPRERMGRHTFLGGNFFMLGMLNRYRTELGVVAPSAELHTAAQATLRQLETETASVSIARTTLLDGRLDVDVAVRNLTGHKLPTGYPSRRVWLHLTVRDGQGRIVFESGAATPSGAIPGNDSDTDPTRFEPHYDEIRRADEVQIYEAVMVDPRGAVTTGLLQATDFVKDNRLLPHGFNKANAESDIAVHGSARQDADFTSAGDDVHYRVDVASTATAGPFQIDVELRFQPIGFRWADNLRRYEAAETRRFVSFFDSMAASSSAVLARSRTYVR
jgi:hypothetical protein